MWLDERTEFADDNTDVQAGASTVLIGDVIDSTVVRDLGNGQPVYLVIRTGTEIITGGSAGTCQFKLVSDSAAAIATNGDATEHLLTDTFVTDGTDANDAVFKAGATIFFGALPLEGSNPYERYLGILAVIATTTITAGTLNAFLTIDPGGWKSYADANN